MIDRDTIIKLARESHWMIACGGMPPISPWWDMDVPALERFAALVAAAEREACAVTAWSAGMDAHNAVRGLPCDARDVGSKAAAAIRARGGPATREERRAHDERYLRATVEQTRTGRFA